MKEKPKVSYKAYEIDIDSFKKALGLPKTKRVSWVFKNLDDTVEIHVEE